MSQAKSFATVARFLEYKFPRARVGQTLRALQWKHLGVSTVRVPFSSAAEQGEEHRIQNRETPGIGIEHLTFLNFFENCYSGGQNEGKGGS